MPKRKSPSSSPSSSSSSSTTPWDAREAHLNALRAAYDKKRGTHHVIWRVSDPLTTLHDRWEVQEWSEETKKEERRKLTQEQVDTTTTHDRQRRMLQGVRRLLRRHNLRRSKK